MKGYVDASRWLGKSAAVRRAMARGYQKGLKAIAQDIYKAAQKNLKGPHYGPKQKFRGQQTGKMPIPRVTGTLARSLKMRRITPQLWAVFADSKVARYAVYVHEGTSRVRPRRFIGDAVRLHKQKYLMQLRNTIKGEIRGEGLR